MVPAMFETEIPARETVTEKVRVRSSEIEPGEFSVPEVLITYHYPDSQGRDIPVEVRSRVPVRRELTLQALDEPITVDGELTEAAWESATPLPLEFWTSSQYQVEADPAPQVSVLYDGDAVFLSVAATDNEHALFPEGPGSRVLSDGISISAGPEKGAAKEFLFQIFDPDGRLYERPAGGRDWTEVKDEAAGARVAPGDAPGTARGDAPGDARGVAPQTAPQTAPQIAVVEDGPAYRLEARIPAELLFGSENPAGHTYRFNVSLYDNDANPYPLVRRWTAGDRDEWGTLVVKE